MESIPGTRLRWNHSEVLQEGGVTVVEAMPSFDTKLQREVTQWA